MLWPSGSQRSDATRSATVMAAMRLGCVQTMFSRVASPLAMALSSSSCGTCVVLPQPVEPEIRTTGLEAMAATIWSATAVTGSCARLAAMAAYLGLLSLASWSACSCRAMLNSSCSPPPKPGRPAWPSCQGLSPQVGGSQVISRTSGVWDQGEASKSGCRHCSRPGAGRPPCSRPRGARRPSSRSSSSGATWAMQGAMPSSSAWALVWKGGSSPILQRSMHRRIAT
mmetsp:Transcript_77015/g.217930  ORF Transcript_77015/g.217930 Transcript_77015/m.217930 type:complete len:226 (+) Transcript_77015:783-1460(+)